MTPKQSECIIEDDEITLKNGIIKRSFSIKQTFRTTKLVFEEDGRNLVNPKTTLGIDNEIIAESTPDREVRLGINGKPPAMPVEVAAKDIEILLRVYKAANW